MGPTIKYLGMKIDFTEDTCKLTMRNYIEELLKDSKVTSLENSPAAYYLFDLDETSERLDNECSDKFHSIVASLLYLVTRTRPDILFPVGYLCSRLGTSSKNDDKKLLRVLSYLNATIDLPFILVSVAARPSIYKGDRNHMSPEGVLVRTGFDRLRIGSNRIRVRSIHITGPNIYILL